ncbi:MAG: hypothetical protein ABI592_08485, partial [Acidobacteriota bacterium]
MKSIAALTAFLVSGTLLGQNNTTQNTAAAFQWGQKATSSLSGSTSQYWFQLAAERGRSYCVEAGSFEGSYGDKIFDPELVVLDANGTTAIADDDDIREEPSKGLILSRACWVHTLGTQNVFAKLFPHNMSFYTATVTLRFVETTLFCPWFFIAGDYNAFSLIRNTSSTSLPNVVVTWRGLDGAVAGSTTVTIPANGTVVLNARTFVNPALFSNGSVEIAHAGSPDQLQG